MKPFNLELAKQGHPVITRKGKKARIICFDRNGDAPIVALVETELVDTACMRDNNKYNKPKVTKTEELPFMFYANGNYFKDSSAPCDLFMA